VTVVYIHGNQEILITESAKPMRRKLLSVTVASSLLAIASTSLFADSIDHTGQPYIAPSIGVLIPFSNQIDAAPSANIAVGYNFSKSFAAQIAVNGSTGTTIRAEGIWNLPSQTRWTPYLAGGVGYFHLGQSGVGVDVGGGLKYDFDQNLGVSGNYRYLLQASNGIPNGSLIDFGVTYSFGGASDVSSSMLSSSEKDAMVHKKYVLPKGVSECTDLTSDITKESVGCYTISGNTVAMHLDVKYTFDSSKLTPSGESAMERLAAFMTQYPDTDVTLKGYASDEGLDWQEAYNQRLSKARALASKAFLISKSISESRIEILGEGYDNPAASNATAEGRAENRRVETVITGVPLRQEEVK